MLTPDQIHTIMELLDRQLLYFAGSTLGPQVLSDQDKQLLADHRVDYQRIYDASKDLVVTNFHLGMLSNVLGDERTQQLNYNQLYKFIESGQHIPLNERECATIESIKMQSMADIRSAKGRIFQDINNIVGDQLLSTRANQEQFIRQQVLQGTEQRKSRIEIARNIARLTGDWSRNFNKSVQYISHTALNEGRLAVIQRRYGSNTEAKVFFQVQSDACDHCVKHYLTAGPGSEPIIFTLKQLQQNGTNIGRKTAEWKATIQPLHVNCRCLLTEYIEGTKWDGQRFVTPKGGYKSPLNRDKIRIVFDGKEYFV